VLHAWCTDKATAFLPLRRPGVVIKARERAPKGGVLKAALWRTPEHKETEGDKKGTPVSWRRPRVIQCARRGILGGLHATTLVISYPHY